MYDHTHIINNQAAPQRIASTEWYYGGHRFHMYENRGCDSCIRTTKPPYLPPFRGVHITYHTPSAAYLCGYCIRRHNTAILP